MSHPLFIYYLWLCRLSSLSLTTAVSYDSSVLTKHMIATTSGTVFASMCGATTLVFGLVSTFEEEGGEGERPRRCHLMRFGFPPQNRRFQSFASQTLPRTIGRVLREVFKCPLYKSLDTTRPYTDATTRINATAVTDWCFEFVLMTLPHRKAFLLPQRWRHSRWRVLPLLLIAGRPGGEKAPRMIPHRCTSNNILGKARDRIKQLGRLLFGFFQQRAIKAMTITNSWSRPTWCAVLFRCPCGQTSPFS